MRHLHYPLLLQQLLLLRNELWQFHIDAYYEFSVYFLSRKTEKKGLSLSLSLSQKKLNSLHIFHVVSKYVYS